MKRRHILLFLISCLLLYIGDIFASGLIALALIFQMNLLFFEIPLTKISQLAALKLFFFSIPIFFFLGGIHSFLFVYARDSQWLFLLFSIFIGYCLFFVANFLCFFTFKFLLQNQFKVAIAVQDAVANVRHKKRDLFMQTSFLFILSLVPFLNTEWKIIFSLMAYQLYSFRHQLKRVFGFSH